MLCKMALGGGQLTGATSVIKEAENMLGQEERDTNQSESGRKSVQKAGRAAPHCTTLQTPRSGDLKCLRKTAGYLQATNTHPPVYLKSSVGYFYPYYNVNASEQFLAPGEFSSAFWNFLEFFCPIFSVIGGLQMWIQRAGCRL